MKHRPEILRFCAAALVAISLAGAAPAQSDVRQDAAAPVDAGPTPMLSARRHLLQAQHIDQTYVIDVLTVVSPQRPPAPGEKIPVVYVVDGNVFFPIVAGTASVLALVDSLPSMLVVGVGYDVSATPPQERPFVVQELRTRDLTPSIDEAFLADVTASYEERGASYPSHGRPGGAAAFLAFINEEVKPFIAETYPFADPEDAALVGHSFGGLFALYALFNAPASFDRYVIGSPSTFWDDQLLLNQEATFEDAPVRLFMSVGALEEDGMIAPARELDARLGDGRRPSLDHAFHIFEDENHFSVVPATFSRGLREVFE